MLAPTPFPLSLCGALIAALPAAELPWLSEVQTPPPSIPADAPALPPLLIDDQGRAITTRQAWLARRAELREWWLMYLYGDEGREGLPTRERCDLTPEVVSIERIGRVMRKLIRLQFEPGVFTEAYLLYPSEHKGRLPGVVVFHPTVDCTIRQPAGLEGPDSLQMGLHLAERGFVALCPRCFIWDYAGKTTFGETIAELARRHPTWRGMGKMVFDGSRAADYLASVPFVDPHRLGCVGHSLGAKEALCVAAFDERFRAAVSSEGGIGLTFSNWDAPWYLGPDIRQPTFTHENDEVLALIAPRAFLLLGGEDADGGRSWPFIAAAKLVCDLLGAGDRIGLLTHSSGHSFPPVAQECAYQWLEHFLRPPP